MSVSADRQPQGTPCWVSLLVNDLPAAQDFYSSLFGWQFRPGPQPFGPYTRAVLGDHHVAGIGALPQGRRLPVTWTTYLASEDADTTAELIRDHCGTVAVGPLDAEQAGRLAIAADPAGAVFGVWEPNDDPTADQVHGWPGTVAWNELITRDDAFLATFYSAVFGYKVEHPETPYLERSTLLVEGKPVAGITSVGDDLPRGRPPYWRTYFAVSDIDAATQLLVKLGGQVVSEPQDTVYGRTASVTDPEGASFALVESAARMN